MKGKRLCLKEKRSREMKTFLCRRMLNIKPTLTSGSGTEVNFCFVKCKVELFFNSIGILNIKCGGALEVPV